MSIRPRIWFVDDLQSNLDAFVEAHKPFFAVTPFTEPRAVLSRLDKEHPDALLCDVFFYDDPAEAQRIEDRISKEAEAIRQTASEIGATDDRYLAGIALMEQIKRKYHGPPPFPVYAYTSKGPYLLTQFGWDRIAATGANVLPKNRYGRTVERMLIQRDIEQCKETHSWSARAMKHLKTLLITWGLLGTLLGILIQRFLLG